MRYAYLGPQGSFSQAALQKVSYDTASHVPYPSVDAAIAALRAGDIDAALVPIENSVEGVVPATMDGLAHGSELQIVAEVVLPVSFVLATAPGVEFSEIKRVSTHPHAWAQCRNSIQELIPGVAYISANSTSGAAKKLSEDPTAAGFDAFIGSQLAAELYGLKIQAEQVGDRGHAETRFIVVTVPGALPEATGSDKTSLLVALPEDRPGGLINLLEQFATRGVNLTRIESRPTGNGLGSYFFVIDAEGHIADARVSDALRGLYRVSPNIRFLGSYPRADGHQNGVATGNSNADFAAAEQWVKSLLAP